MKNKLSQFEKDIKNKWRKVFDNKLKKANLNWFKITQIKYSSTNQVNNFDLFGTKIYYRNGLELIYSLKEIFVEELYKIDLSDSSEPYIIDCGANIGLSVLYLKKQFPNAKIIAFEPDKQNFNLLKKNTAHLTDLTVESKAVWKKNEVIEFAASGTLSSQIVNNKEGQSPKTNKVEAIRLKDIIKRPVDFLKLDIEGAEFEVLKDCADKLNLIKFIFIEYHGRFNQINELSEIFVLLSKNDFKYYIKEASEIYPTPFSRKDLSKPYDIQLNIFCFKN